MKDLNTTLKPRSLMLGLMAGCLMLTTGCFSTDANVSGSAEVAGVLQGDAETAGALGKSAAEVEGAIVTVHEVTAEGTLGPAVGEAQTDAQGAFVVKTDLKGPRTLIVKAVREGREWKARLKDELREGSSHWSRPLNLESSIEADVWLELQKTAPGRAVYSHEASASVDAEVAVSASAVYRGADSAARAQLVARLANVARAASQARAGAMAAVAVRAEAAAAKSLEAEAEFRARLHEAKRDTAQIRAARAAFVRAVAQAHLQAEVKATMYARASEAAYRAAVRASERTADSLSASVRAAVARCGARTLAVASDVAVQAQFHAAGATEAQVDNVAQAGAAFMIEVEAAASKDACDSAMARYRAEAEESFDSAFAELAVTLQAVSGALDSLSIALGLEIGAAAGDSETGEAYMSAQTQATAHIQTALAAMNDEAKAEAVAEVFAFLSVRSQN